MRGPGRRDQRHRRRRSAAADEHARPRSSTKTATLQVIRFKTAKLFEAGARLGAVARRCGAGESRSAARATAARSAPRSSSSTTCSTTRATASEIGKNVGDDLREGKPTLPLIYRDAARHADAARRLSASDRATASGDFAADRRESCAETGALEYARALARARSAQRARSASTLLPQTIFRDSLLHLIDSAVDRDLASRQPRLATRRVSVRDHRGVA